MRDAALTTGRGENIEHFWATFEPLSAIMSDSEPTSERFWAILKGLSVLFVLESGGTLTLGHCGLTLTSVLFLILLFVLFKRLNAKTMFLS